MELIVIILYFALTVAIGIWSGKKAKSSDSFHGAEMGLMAIVCASAGEWLGGTATTGVSEWGFIFGVSGAWYTIANGIGVLILALFFAKLYRSLSSVTVPGIIEKFFGINARIVSSILLTVVMLAVGLSQMIAAGKLGQSLLGLPFTPTVIVFAIIFIVYTLAGGMNAVASTNQLHLFVMYGGAILGLVMAVYLIGGVGEFSEGIKVVEEANAGTNFFDMFAVGGSRVSSWIIAGILGACTAQAGIQPILAAKDVATAKKASIITAIVVAPFGIFTALLGMGARVLSHNGQLLDIAGNNVVDAKLALPTLMLNMPGGGLVGGLILASILAAILSTVSPIILSSGTMVTKDLYQRVLKPNATDKEVLFMSRVTTALSGVICCVGAIAIVNMSSVLELVYAAYSLRGAIFIIVLYGIYWKLASQKAACISMVLTGVSAIAWVGIKLANVADAAANGLSASDIPWGGYPMGIGPDFAISETYVAVGIAIITMLIFSFIFKPNDEEKALKLATDKQIKEVLAQQS